MALEPGVWINPNFAVDLEYGMNNADFKSDSPRDGHQWEGMQLDVAAVAISLAISVQAGVHT